MNSLKVQVTQSIKATGSNVLAGLANGPGSDNSDTKQDTFTSAVANNLAGGANECHFKLYTIVGAGTATIDLTSVVNLAGATVALARVKGYRFRLLRANETAPDGTAGTAAASVTIGDAGSNANNLNLAVALNGATGGSPLPTVQVKNGGCLSYDDGSAAGITVDGTHKNVLVTNDDAGVTAQLLVAIWGGLT